MPSEGERLVAGFELMIMAGDQEIDYGDIYDDYSYIFGPGRWASKTRRLSDGRLITPTMYLEEKFA